MITLPAPEGFQGLREDLPVERYDRNLPHWRQDGATYFVTFRLNDSIPMEHQRLLNDLKTHWERENPPPHTREKLEELTRNLGERLEKWLDAGMASCWLRDEPSRQILVGSLHFFDRVDDDLDQDAEDAPEPHHELGAYVVMPNHVHAVVRPLDPLRWPLENILHSWKRHSSLEINRLRGGEGSIWFQESFDRIVRDLEHLWRCVRYIGRNPAKAGLPAGDFVRWIRPSWAELGWAFEDE